MKTGFDGALLQDLSRIAAMYEPFKVWDLGLRKPSERFRLSESMPQDLAQRLDSILVPYNRISQNFITEIEGNLEGEGQSIWALILFEQDMPTMGHFLRNRRNAFTYRGVVYRKIPYNRYPDQLPGLGGALITEKEDARPLEFKGDILMEMLWHLVKHLDPDHRWCLIAPYPDEGWIRDHSDEAYLAAHHPWNGKYYDIAFPWNENLGIRAVEFLYHKAFQASSEWSMANHVGFSWWPHSYMQTVRSNNQAFGDDTLHYKMDIVSDFVIGTEADEATIYRELAGLCTMLSGISAPIYDPSDGSVELLSAIWINDENAEWIMRDASAFALLQATDAERFAEVFAARVGAKPDRTAHPVQGVRAVRDTVLAAREEIFTEVPGAFNRWFQPEHVLDTMHFLGDLGADVSFGEEGFSLWVPIEGERTALINITFTEHYSLGEGCWIMLNMPIEGDLVDISREANALNIMEFRGSSRVTFAGAWSALKRTSESKAQLCFGSYLPNALFAENKLTNYLLYMMERARWAGEMPEFNKPLGE